MEVVAYDIQKNPAVEAMGVKYVEIEDALPWADVVSVHVPLLKSTHHFINGDRSVEGAFCVQPVTYASWLCMYSVTQASARRLLQALHICPVQLVLLNRKDSNAGCTILQPSRLQDIHGLHFACRPP